MSSATRPIALRAAKDALANLGVHEEGGNNDGKFVNVYQKSVGIGPGDPWCAGFAYYRYLAASISLSLPTPVLICSGYTPDWKSWAVKKGLWITRPRAISDPSLIRVGDLVLFYSPAKGRIYHIGIVVEVEAWGVWSVEGNTGPESGDPLTVNAEGDGVYRKKRNWSELGSKGGFIRVNC